ncbi:TPA: hypothetical protein N0F65_006507 [Lagenidium giganteum]|uniref:ER membrane protein complex subunit 1 n=1 Tax=Lagenidium giganteum TaxID=4803 RepID=A0AAV2YRU1_9STRA|nr:TPA: hypothetical protein N0F65_006507 [Lagenidium giganteum]
MWGVKRAAALALACVCLATRGVHAIYEDQAGELDWSVENIGRATAVAYGGGDKRSHGSLVRGTSRALYVATDEHSRTLSRIDSKTGAIKWRRIFDEGKICLHGAASDSVEGIQLTNYGLLSVSGSGKNVRMWDIADGTLVWDNVAYSGAAPVAVEGIHSVGDDRVLVLASSFALVANLKDEKFVWKSDLAAANVGAFVSSQLSTDGSVLFALVKRADSAEQTLLTINVQSGEFAAHEAAAKDIQVLLPATKGDEVLAVAFDKSSLSVHPVKADGKRDAAHKTDIAALKLHNSKSTPEFASIKKHTKNALVVRLSSGKRVYLKITESYGVDLVAVVAKGGLIVESLSDEPALFHVVTSGKQVQLTSYTEGADQPTVQWEAEFDTSVYGGDVVDAFVGCSTRKKDAAAPRCRALLVMKDDAMVMSTNDESSDKETTVVDESKKNVLWTREESLAHVKEARWITPAESEMEKEALRGIPSFTEELALEVNRLKNVVQHVIKFSSALLEDQSSEPVVRTRKEPVNAHFFGLSKYIVLLTESGRIFAIRAETNEVAWTSYVGRDHRLFVMRDHPALGAGAELLLVSNTSSLVWLDGDDGRQIETANTASEEKSWVVVLPKRKHHIDDDVHVRRSVAIVSPTTLDVKLFPKVSADTHPELDNFFFYRFDEATNTFRGYVIDAEADGHRAREVWSVVLPAEQRLAASSRQRKSLVIDSAVTITGDDSLLLKYLNPNMFGFATVSEEQVDGYKGLSPVLHFTLLDSVSGRVIHRVRHVNGAGPIHVVQSENWVVYSFWNTKDKRTEMVSLALYEGAVGTHNLNPWKRPSWSDVRSSYDPRPPFVLQKSFIYPTRVRSLGVTVTSRGITPQFILVGMETGQIYKLMRNFVDPRQTEKPPTPEEQMEGLMQYSPLVPVYNNPYAMITYNKTVGNLKTISTSPVELESTSLMFAFGLDLFYARLAPAKSFDLLPADFNYEMLVLLCIGFLVATTLSRNLARRKALNEAWK